MMSLTFGLFTQVSGSGPLGPLVLSKCSVTTEKPPLQLNAVFTTKKKPPIVGMM